MSNFVRNALKEFYAKFSLWGTTSASADAPLRANSERNQLQIEPVENWIQKDPIVLGTGANTVIYNPGSTATELYLIDFKLVNYGAAGNLIKVGFDIGATAALTHYAFFEYMPIYTTTDWQGPFEMAGDDDMMAWAASGTSTAIHLRVRKVFR